MRLNERMIGGHGLAFMPKPQCPKVIADVGEVYTHRTGGKEVQPDHMVGWRVTPEGYRESVFRFSGDGNWYTLRELGKLKQESAKEGVVYSTKRGFVVASKVVGAIAWKQLKKGRQKVKCVSVPGKGIEWETYKTKIETRTSLYGED